MAESRKVLSLVGASGIALLALTSAAFADGGSIKDAPAEPARQFTYSFSITGTSDYVFRGISQTDNDPTIQGSIGIGYGIFYAGAWASGLDWACAGCNAADAEIEIDWYGGIKPTWGKATFDFGVIYYTYPGASDPGLEVDYVELKAGVSGEVLSKLTAGAVAYYSPEFAAKTGEVWTFEGTLAYALPKVWIFDPIVSGLVGYEVGQDAAYNGPGSDNYTYWNAGLALVVEKFTFDFRYWDTDLTPDVGGLCSSVGQFQCDERFVFSTTVALP